MAGREAEALRDHTGEPWARLFAALDGCTSGPPPSGRLPPRSPCDVKRVPARDMELFEQLPETDKFIIIPCEICGRLVTPPVLRRHVEESHTEADIAALRAKTRILSTPIKKAKLVVSSAPPPAINDTPNEAETSNVVCSLCSQTVPTSAFRRHTLKVHADDPSAVALPPLPSLKIKTVKKPSPTKKPSPKSESPPELIEELSKEFKKSKSKKSKSPVPPELEPILPAASKRVLTGGPPDLQPVADVPKKSKKRPERIRTDKVYDPDKNCGVINDTGKPCLRSIFCKVHLIANKRAVPNRSMPYDTLAKMIKSQNEGEKRQEERKPKLEKDISPPMPALLINRETWQEPVVKGEGDPVVKRMKTEDNELDLDLPSDFVDLFEDSLMDVAETPVIPRPEPIIRWSLEGPVSPPTPPPPPLVFADLPWQPLHPRPIATNTFGCCLVGGLLTKNKSLEEFRKHVISAFNVSAGEKAQSLSVKPASPAKKMVVAASRRKRKNSGGAAPDTITNLLQHAVANSNSSPTPPNGVNGVPLRLYNNSSQSSFIQLNLCPSK